MEWRDIASSVLLISAALGCVLPSVAHAQEGSNVPAASADTTSKQAQKAQRKAERQARRAKKNAELSQLEKNGYNPGRDQTSYPQDLQKAQQRIETQKQGAKPASAP